jgi:hypothetical protein
VLGELGLDGSIAPVAGVLPAAIGANARGEGLICPAACGPEAAWASPEIEIIAAASLNSLGSRQPILLIETIKCDKNALRAALQQLGYIAIEAGMNFLAVHNADKCLAEIRAGKPRTP